MSITMAYRGFIGTVEYSREDSVYHGKVKGLRSLISYEGQTLEQLRSDFRGAVDAYCQLQNALRDAREHRELAGPFTSASAVMETLNRNLF